MGDVPRRRLPASRRPRRRTAAAVVAPGDAAGPPRPRRRRRLRLRAAGAVHDERFGTIVDHSGGLPGYGSNMRWLPGRRVGVIALANSTYAPMGALTRRMLDVLDDHGLVPPAVIPLTPAVQRAAEELVALLSDWDDAVADALFADNVALDQPYAERAAAAAELGSLQIERVVGRVGDLGDDPRAAADASSSGWRRSVASRTTRSFSNVWPMIVLVIVLAVVAVVAIAFILVRAFPLRDSRSATAAAERDAGDRAAPPKPTRHARRRRRARRRPPRRPGPQSPAADAAARRTPRPAPRRPPSATASTRRCCGRSSRPAASGRGARASPSARAATSTAPTTRCWRRCRSSSTPPARTSGRSSSSTPTCCRRSRRPARCSCCGPPRSCWPGR